jgi:hypothetical protein
LMHLADINENFIQIILADKQARYVYPHSL